MPEVTVYSSRFCGFCRRAKAVLADKGVDFVEIEVGLRPSRRAEMRARAGGATSVPQIFVDDVHVGGCDDLQALEAEGKLDALLEGAVD